MRLCPVACNHFFKFCQQFMQIFLYFHAAFKVLMCLDVRVFGILLCSLVVHLIASECYLQSFYLGYVTEARACDDVTVTWWQVLVTWLNIDWSLLCMGGKIICFCLQGHVLLSDRWTTSAHAWSVIGSHCHPSSNTCKREIMKNIDRIGSHVLSSFSSFVYFSKQVVLLIDSNDISLQNIPRKSADVRLTSFRPHLKIVA